MIRKKCSLKTIVAITLACAMSVASIGVGSVDSSAAAKVKLSKTSISVKEGKTQTVKIRNAKKSNVKNLTVKSSNPASIKAKASGKLAVKITGKKACTSAKISVTVKLKKKVAGKKTYKLKLTANCSFSAEDNELVDAFIENFMILANVPRPSKHEERISNCLKDWAENLGLTVKQNEVNDLIFDVPATTGKENLPLVGLQVHMDMVCVARDGVKYDPLNDPIKVVVDKKTGKMKADGTSLGADDGAGVSMVMMIAQNKMAHGPLRIIITTDEEKDMTGVKGIKKEDLDGVKYLINVDSEWSDTVTLSSAAAASIDAEKTPEVCESVKKLPLKIKISGFMGGHSGVDIDKNRCNACLAMGSLLAGLREKVPFEMATFDSGAADNAIPASAEALIIVDPEDRDTIMDYLELRKKEFIEKYKHTDGEMKLTVTDDDPVQTVLSDEQTQGILDFISNVINGVYSMSKIESDLVESSTNLGILSANPDKIIIGCSARSSDPQKFDEVINKIVDLAQSKGFKTTVAKSAKAWPFKEDSVLVPVIKAAYKSVTGTEMKAKGVHGGLECGTFAELVEGLDIASIGPDVKDSHSPDETLYLNSVPTVWKLLEKTLATLP